MSSIDRKYLEHGRDAQLWHIARLTAPEPNGHVADVMALAAKASELAEHKAGKASNAHVEYTTDYLEAVKVLAQLAVPLAKLSDFLECVTRLEEDGIDVLPAAEALGGVAAVFGDSADAATALQAVRASRSALG